MTIGWSAPAGTSIMAHAADKTVGRWVLDVGGDFTYCFYMYKKPNILARLLAKLIFDLKWLDLP